MLLSIITTTVKHRTFILVFFSYFVHFGLVRAALLNSINMKRQDTTDLQYLLKEKKTLHTSKCHSGVKLGGGSIQLWECFATWGSGRLAVIKGKKYYQDVLKSCSCISWWSLSVRLKWGSVMQHVSAEINQKESEDGRNCIFQWPSLTSFSLKCCHVI